MISIYVAAYNLESNLFDWQQSLNNYLDFADEVVVGTTIFSNGITIKLLKDFAQDCEKVKIVFTEFSLDTPDFDGNIKNAALQACSNEYCILLDLDEAIPLNTKHLWLQGCEIIEGSNIDGLLIPSVNLCRDKYHYKDIGFKFYLHRRFGMNRGIWNGAKLNNGFIDISKSDTTEVIDNFGNLGKFKSYSNDIRDLRSGGVPYVFHDWGSNFDRRIAQNQFWKKTWELRAGREVNDIILDKKELEKISVFPHNLPNE